MKKPDKDRYFLQIAFKGTHYRGWQVQKNQRSVQAELEKNLSIIFQQQVKAIGCGRTDTKVHAKKFILHFDIEQVTVPKNLLYKLNGLLPRDIWVQKIMKSKNEDAHARFSAMKRTYEYYICMEKDPFQIDLATFFYRPINFELLQETSKILFEYEDFTAFSRKSADVKSYLCKIYKAEWERPQENMLKFTVQANRFVRTMIRIIVGTSVKVGIGKISVDDFREALVSKDRAKAGSAAPADGLYLTDVIYPDHFFEEIITDYKPQWKSKKLI